MKSRWQIGWVFATLLIVSFPTTSLFAQDQGAPGSPSNDPPARVARIQYISGEVSLQPGGANDWVAANLNRPLTTSDRVWADKNSRVELNVGGGYLRMNSESSLTLTNVGDNTIQAELDQGILELTVRHLEPGEIYEVDTPNLAFTVMKPGVYRFDVYPNEDQTWVTVHKGSGEATGRGSAVKVSDGQQVRFSGQNSLQHVAEAAPAPDGFDDWAKVRDQRLESSQSARYVAPGVIGYEDLDTYGNWQVAPTYGAVWVPTSVPVGWAPYRFGRWVWINPWGWTWVDDAPWGFAPFHYGRWVSWRGGWGWAPGPIIGVGWRPFFAPAVVGWIGGPGWGVSIGFGIGGGCGWFPLGWGEPFYPWYRGFRGGFVSQNYIRNVNITNTRITNITNVTNNYYNNNINNTHYVNRNVAGAVTAAPKSALASGQNIARVGTTVPRSEQGKGEVVRSADVTPNRGAVLGGQTPRNTAMPPRTAADRPAVTRMTPPARQANPMADAHSIPQTPATLGARTPNTVSDATGNHNVPRPSTTTNQTAVSPVRSNEKTTAVSSTDATATTHNVPRPPDRGSSATPSTAGYSSQPGYPSQPGYSSQQGLSHAVPKPPYAGGAAPSGTSAAVHNSSGNNAEHVTTSPHQATPVQQVPASATHNQQPQNKSKESKPHESPKANPGSTSVRVPQPPAGYSYHAAPAYSTSSYTGGNASYGGTARSYGASGSAYGSGRSSYSAPTTTYRSSGTYSSAPTYNARATAPAAPRYSAPSAPNYSGGGGSGGGRYSGGGSGSRSQPSTGHTGGHSR